MLITAFFVSCRHVHLHVISEDRISPALKTKKHYNSFRPDLGFFISIMDVQRWIQNEDEAVLRERVDVSETCSPRVFEQTVLPHLTLNEARIPRRSSLAEPGG